MTSYIKQEVGWGNGGWGNRWGGYDKNQQIEIKPNFNESYYTILFNGTAGCYINLLGTNVNSCFTNTLPTGGVPATTMEYVIDPAHNRLNFLLNGTIVCYAATGGFHYGAP